jgi:Amino acid permease/Domain of unknown function (DUF1989)
MSEETRDPRRVAPRTVLTALAAAGVLASLLVLAALLAAPSLTDGRLATDGLSYVLTSRLGDGLGRVLLCDVALAVAVATLAIQTSATRMLFSMARDRALPFSGVLARVSPRTGQPPAPAPVVGVLAAALLPLGFASPEAWLAIGTTCIVMLYLAYAMVTGPLLLRRLRGGLPTGTDESGNPLFSLGRWGIPVKLFRLAAAKHGLEPRDLPPSLSFFKGVRVEPDGALEFTGSAGPRTAVTLRAEQPLTVLLANVPHPLDPRPAYTCGPLEVTARPGSPTGPGDPLWDATPEGRRAFLNAAEQLAARGIA